MSGLTASVLGKQLYILQEGRLALGFQISQMVAVMWEKLVGTVQC